MGYSRVVTHNDFDGLVSAALCSHVLGMENFFFTGPRDIQSNRFAITERDIVCDLPYPLDCGMWFDHHPGNLEDVKLRGLDIDEIEGRFSPDPSCARTVYDYFSQEWELADYFDQTVAEADMIDSFDYQSVEDWRRPTPGKNVDAAIRAPFPDNSSRLRFLNQLTLWLRDYSLEEIQYFPQVKRLRVEFEQHENQSKKVIADSTRFMPGADGKDIVFIDLTGYKNRPHIVRHMAYLVFPEVKAVAVLANPEFNGAKTNNVSISMSLAVSMNNENHGKDVGEIMRRLNAGDGHEGAGAGLTECSSKEEMLRTKENLMGEILEIWKQQKPKGIPTDSEAGD
jgi:hypothetical protein